MHIYQEILTGIGTSYDATSITKWRFFSSTYQQLKKPLNYCDIHISGTSFVCLSLMLSLRLMFVSQRAQRAQDEKEMAEENAKVQENGDVPAEVEEEAATAVPKAPIEKEASVIPMET